MNWEGSSSRNNGSDKKEKQLKSVRFLLIVVIAWIFFPQLSRAEDRIILYGGVNAWQHQNMDTPAADQYGHGDVGIARGQTTEFWVYKHGIDLNAFALRTSSVQITAEIEARIDGLKSNIFLHKAIDPPGVNSRSGGICIKIVAKRNMRVGKTITLAIRNRIGRDEQITLRVVCIRPNTGIPEGADWYPEQPAKLKLITPTEATIRRGERKKFTVVLDKYMECFGNNRLRIDPYGNDFTVENEQGEAVDSITFGSDTDRASFYLKNEHCVVPGVYDVGVNSGLKKLKITVPIPAQHAITRRTPKNTLTVRLSSPRRIAKRKSGMGGIKVMVGTSHMPGCYGTQITDAHGVARFPNIPQSPPGVYYILTIPSSGKGRRLAFQKKFRMPGVNTVLNIPYSR